MPGMLFDYQWRAYHEEAKAAFVAVPAALFLGGGVANAGEPIKDTGAMACVNDKWDVKEPKKDTSWSNAGLCVAS